MHDMFDLGTRFIYCTCSGRVSQSLNPQGIKYDELHRAFFSAVCNVLFDVIHGLWDISPFIYKEIIRHEVDFVNLDTY